MLLFICTLKCSRRKPLLILAAGLLILLCLLALRFCAAEKNTPMTNEQCTAYLAELGWEVDPEPVETLMLTLPDPLQEPYLSYNVLQQSQGFDLSRYCGKTLERRSYTVKNHPSGSPCRAELYLLGAEVVAGSILCTGEDGYTAPLAFPQG